MAEPEFIDMSGSATVTLKEAAELIGVHRTTLAAAVKRGDLPFPVIRIGARYRVLKAHLVEYLRTGHPVFQESAVRDAQA